MSSQEKISQHPESPDPNLLCWRTSDHPLEPNTAIARILHSEYKAGLVLMPYMENPYVKGLEIMASTETDQKLFQKVMHDAMRHQDFAAASDIYKWARHPRRQEFGLPPPKVTPLRSQEAQMLILNINDTDAAVPHMYKLVSFAVNDIMNPPKLPTQ